MMDQVLMCPDHSPVAIRESAAVLTFAAQHTRCLGAPPTAVC
uniref:Uncharacterized protein n=1 Tax=Anguilla anguilla TaxID=7936 RepID=A0A0E9UHF5_ANGAN